jgi:hypothetical protein
MDYSEAQRRQMRRAMDLLSEKGILDELGVGTIRDALSDALFPGTSTIQTRARYFLFTPWIYQEAERLKVSSARIVPWRRQREFEVTNALLHSGAVSGAFGRQAGDRLRRLASEVYPGHAAIERHVSAYPMSRDVTRLEAFRRSLAIYRIVFGQPRQDDLLEYLAERIPTDRLAGLSSSWQIDLCPP